MFNKWIANKMKSFLKTVRRLIQKLALVLGYLSLAVAVVLAGIAITNYLSGRDSPAKEPETAISRAFAELWIPEGKVIAGPFDVQIWQYGKVVTPVAGIVTLDRQPFDIKNQHNEDQVIYLTASSSPELKKQFDSGESISDIEIFGPGRGWAEGPDNADRNLVLGDEGLHYLYYKKFDGGGRYNGREVIEGLNYFIRSVASVGGDPFFSSDSLYLTAVKSAFVGSKDYPRVVEGRTSIEINFRQLSGKVYIHPECLDSLAPWSKGNPESIDCSGLDLSKVETQGDEFGVKYGEGKAIAIEKISATSVYKAPDHIKECFSNAKTTIEINICSKEMYEYVNEVESKYFNKAIARWKAPISRDAEIIVGEENAKSAFKELYNSRDHFVNYRDQFCGSLYWTAGGTRKNQVYLHCKSELTKQFTLRVWEGHLKRGNGDPVYQDFPKPLFDYSTLY